MKAFRLLALALLVALAGCAATQNGQAVMGPDTSGSPVIFSFDGRTYTQAEYAAILNEQIGPGVADLLNQGQTREQIEQLAAETNVRGVIFDQMIQEAILTRYARQNGIGVNPASVDDAVLAGISPAEDSPFLITAPERQRVAAEQLRLEVIASQTRAEMIRSRHILLAGEAEAAEVIAQLEAGADFAALAAERSLDGDTRESGGELGWDPRGNNPPEFDEVAFAAELNAYVTATSQFGTHVIQVLERQADRPFASFAELREAPNAQQYYEETFLPWYEELRRAVENSGELQIAPNFDPATVPLPFPTGTP